MLRNTAPANAECDIAALKRNREFGQKYNITGTPTLIFANGSRAPGAISAEEVEKMLVAAKTP
jgi:thiol:disulfide interchange protein DsbC